MMKTIFIKRRKARFIFTTASSTCRANRQTHKPGDGFLDFEWEGGDELLLCKDFMLPLSDQKPSQLSQNEIAPRREGRRPLQDHTEGRRMSGLLIFQKAAPDNETATWPLTQPLTSWNWQA
jgi:hypothetical protein